MAPQECPLSLQVPGLERSRESQLGDFDQGWMGEKPAQNVFSSAIIWDLFGIYIGFIWYIM
jgi:hypothetical protein